MEGKAGKNEARREKKVREGRSSAITESEVKEGKLREMKRKS